MSLLQGEGGGIFSNSAMCVCFTVSQQNAVETAGAASPSWVACKPKSPPTWSWDEVARTTRLKAKANTAVVQTSQSLHTHAIYKHPSLAFSLVTQWPSSLEMVRRASLALLLNQQQFASTRSLSSRQQQTELAGWPLAGTNQIVVISLGTMCQFLW